MGEGDGLAMAWRWSVIICLVVVKRYNASICFILMKFPFFSWFSLRFGEIGIWWA